MAPPHAAYLPYADTETDAWRPSPPPDLSGVDVVDLDLEMDDLHRFRARPCGIAVGWAGQTRYLPFRHRGGGPQLDEAVVKRWALTELRGKRIRNLATKQDVHWMESWGVPLRAMGCTFHDVAHSEALLDDHNETFTLEALAQKRLGRGKVTGLPKDGIADLPAQVVAPYAERDVELVRDLAAVYAPLLEAEGLGVVSALEDRVIPASVELERNGLPLDLERLERWNVESRALVERLSWELYREVGFLVNPDAPSDLKRLFTMLRVEWGVTEKGAPSFTAPVMQRAAADSPIIRRVYQLGKLIDLRSKSIVKYLKDQQDGVLYPSFHQLKFDRVGGTVSGRFSSSGPNAQNVTGADKYARDYAFLDALTSEPFVIRRIFRPAPGRQWCCADKHQVELRAAACYAHSRTLLDAYAVDPYTDFHTVTHALIRAVRPATTRTECKTTSFTRLYGGGVGTIADRLGLSYEDGQALVDAYDQGFPDWRRLLKKVERVAQERGYVKTILGRRARFRPGDRYYSAANRVIQGTCADDMKLALVDMYERRHELGVTMRATVHDELDFDVDDDAHAQRVRAFLDQPRVALPVPLLWSAKTGASWDDAK